jgi:diadenosine tetraphosphatase ApaH/serine/threonine PP2A family protein phosphatase
VPGVFLEGPDFYSPDELEYRFQLSDEKAIINVGSVGQPRDRDPRSSFVVVTTRSSNLSAFRTTWRRP